MLRRWTGPRQPSEPLRGRLASRTPCLGQAADLLLSLEHGRRFQLRDDLAEDVAQQMNSCRKVHRPVLPGFSTQSCIVTRPAGFWKADGQPVSLWVAYAVPAGCGGYQGSGFFRDPGVQQLKDLQRAARGSGKATRTPVAARLKRLASNGPEAPPRTGPLRSARRHPGPRDPVSARPTQPSRSAACAGSGRRR